MFLGMPTSGKDEESGDASFPHLQITIGSKEEGSQSVLPMNRRERGEYSFLSDP